MSSILGTYARKTISFKEGKGSYLIAENGDKYLDFVQGIATNVLGHCHEHLVKTIQKQAEKFDHMASATNFIIVPLSFLSGTFYSIEKLPSILKSISELNPFFYIIDGFRYGFLGAQDGSVQFGVLYLIVLSFLSWFAAYILFKKGYKIKS